MFQRVGKEHIRYIFDIAMKLWAGHHFKVPFDDCLWKAMENHREYIKKIEKASQEFKRTRPQMSDFARRTSALND